MQGIPFEGHLYQEYCEIPSESGQFIRNRSPGNRKWVTKPEKKKKKKSLSTSQRYLLGSETKRDFVFLKTWWLWSIA